MSVNVVGGGAVQVALTPANDGVIQVGLSPGIGPSVIVNGTSTSILGVAGINPFIAGANITITTTGGGITVIGLDPPVQSVNGQSGEVVLSAADVTASPAVHSHTTTEIASFTAAAAAAAPVKSVAGRTGNVSLTTTDISGLTSTIQTFGRVVSVQGKTGTVTLSVVDLTAASASHTHIASEVSGVAAASHTHSASEVSGVAAASHTHSASEVSGVAAASHTHSVSDIQNFPTPFSVVNSVVKAGANVTITQNEAAGTVEIASASVALPPTIAGAKYTDPFGFTVNDLFQTGYVLANYGYIDGMPEDSSVDVWLPAEETGKTRLLLNRGNSSSRVSVWSGSHLLATLRGGAWGFFVAKTAAGAPAQPQWVLMGEGWVGSEPGKGVSHHAYEDGFDAYFNSNAGFLSGSSKYRMLTGVPGGVTRVVNLPEPWHTEHGDERHIVNAGASSSVIEVAQNSFWESSLSATLSGGEWGLFVAFKGVAGPGGGAGWRLVAKGSVS